MVEDSLQRYQEEIGQSEARVDYLHARRKAAPRLFIATFPPPPGSSVKGAPAGAPNHLPTSHTQKNAKMTASPAKSGSTETAAPAATGSTSGDPPQDNATAPPTSQEATILAKATPTTRFSGPTPDCYARTSCTFWHINDTPNGGQNQETAYFRRHAHPAHGPAGLAPIEIDVLL